MAGLGSFHCTISTELALWDTVSFTVITCLYWSMVWTDFTVTISFTLTSYRRASPKSAARRRLLPVAPDKRRQGGGLTMSLRVPPTTGPLEESGQSGEPGCGINIEREGLDSHAHTRTHTYTHTRTYSHAHTYTYTHAHTWMILNECRQVMVYAVFSYIFLYKSESGGVW